MGRLTHSAPGGPAADVAAYSALRTCASSSALRPGS
ncbi:hypothetical protein Pgy4_30190, partial [Pseudomonas savastanoi pv. glycinea str. race 4]